MTAPSDLAERLTLRADAINMYHQKNSGDIALQSECREAADLLRSQEQRSASYRDLLAGALFWFDKQARKDECYACGGGYDDSTPEGHAPTCIAEDIRTVLREKGAE